MIISPDTSIVVPEVRIPPDLLDPDAIEFVRQGYGHGLPQTRRKRNPRGGALHPASATGVTMHVEAPDADDSSGFSWASQVGSMSFFDPGNAPEITTAGGKTVVRFDSSNSEYLQGNNLLSTVIGVDVWYAWVRFRVRSYVGTQVHPTATWNNESVIYTSGVRWAVGNNGGANDIGAWQWDGASCGDHIACGTDQWITMFYSGEVISPPASPTNRITVQRLDPGFESTLTYDCDDVLSLASVPYIGRGAVTHSNYDIQMITLANSGYDTAQTPGINQYYLNGGP